MAHEAERDGIRPISVMLIDDDPFFLKMIEAQLRALGVTDIDAHEAPARALAAVAGGRKAHDVVFCDLNMPDIDGVELIRELAQAGYRGALVLVSGENARTLATVERLAAHRGLNVLGAARKPIDIESLRSFIGRTRELPSRAAAVAEGGTRPTQLAPGQAECCSADQLRAAISDGQLTCHYQPCVSLADGALHGVEALVRWQHPSAGLVMPDRFVAVAEANGLIDELTWAVLDRTLAQAQRWRAAGLDLPVSINASMTSLVALDFPDRVARRIGGNRTRITLEITESSLAADRAVALDIASRLSLKHIGLSIDDFGTGHSSLAQLRDFPFDELKLDRTFVHGARERADLRAIVESSVSMAQQLGIHVVAEGIEDQQDWDYVRSTGCDFAQGYFIGRPMPGEALPGWATEWDRRRGAIVRNT